MGQDVFKAPRSAGQCYVDVIRKEGESVKDGNIDGMMPAVDEKRVRKKERELNTLFAGASGKQLRQALAENKQLKLAQTEIKRAAFLTVLLEILEDDISKNGYEEEYQNGQNQRGKKKTVSADLYATYMKNLIAVMKQLHNVLDEAGNGDEGDAFDAF